MYDQTPAPTTPTEDRRRGTAVVIGVLAAVAALLVVTAGGLALLKAGRSDATVQSAAANKPGDHSVLGGCCLAHGRRGIVDEVDTK